MVDAEARSHAEEYLSDIHCQLPCEFDIYSKQIRLSESRDETGLLSFVVDPTIVEALEDDDDLHCATFWVEKVAPTAKPPSSRPKIKHLEHDRAGIYWRRLRQTRAGRNHPRHAWFLRHNPLGTAGLVQGLRQKHLRVVQTAAEPSHHSQARDGEGEGCGNQGAQNQGYSRLVLGQLLRPCPAFCGFHNWPWMRISTSLRV